VVHIEAIEVRYFRSIHRLLIRDLKDLTVFSGRNDVGKSNLLKALNLFFNNEADWNNPFEFSRDFSKVRLNEVRLDTIRGKQFIQVAVHFARGKRYEKSLPERFIVTRTWTRDTTIPHTRSNLPQLYKKGRVPAKKLDRVEAALQRFLNTFRYQYVPAIKDQAFFGHMLSRLQDIIFHQGADDSAIAGAVKGLNESVTSGVNRLKEEFLGSTSIPVDIRLPQQLGELFRAFAVSTADGTETMPINVRGDGIRCRFIPSLLNYISQASNLFHIWGFEEPENSLEHALSTRLAHRMRDEYSKTSQIIVTSHSPAFFSLDGPRVKVCRVVRDPKNHATVPFADVIPPQRLTTELEQELGLLAFQKEFQAKYDAEVSKLEHERTQLQTLLREIQSHTSPIVLTEGKWDVRLLGDAWRKLYSNKQCPFRLIPCSTLEDDSADSTGGAETLRAALESARLDQPITIGLFDRDREGADKFKRLSNNFRTVASNPNLRIQRSGAAAAILLPIPPGREAYGSVLNLSLEFYFSDQHLSTEVDGRRLLLQPRQIRQHVEHLLFEQTVATEEPHLRQIVKDSKKPFAETIVPALPPAAFEPFRPLLALVAQVIEELQAKRHPSTPKPLVTPDASVQANPAASAPRVPQTSSP
jgi:predicted ATPase